MATVASTSNNTTTATRRISWKSSDFRKANTMADNLNEKNACEYPISESTAHDLQTASRGSSIDTPTRLSTSTLCDDEDVEGQPDLGFRVRRKSWRNKLAKYTTVFVIFLVWMLLIAAVLLLTDTFFPMALRSYHTIKTLSAELSNTNFELEALKAKMSVLYQSIGRMGTVTLQTVQELRK
ncbi:hypothetical protein NX059_008060 [Plenodomus lindquistii]|nr:hypothetical protein NX059_008060 [Plenodomus lindquistii]